MRLGVCGEKEAAGFFEQNISALQNGAAAPDRAGDIDSALSGGAHYCIVKKPKRDDTVGTLPECLFSETEASYLKRAGAILDFTGIFRARSPYLKTAFTIAEENYMTALFYAVRFRTTKREKDFAFAADCLGRALHGIADAAAIPHCVGKRYVGKKSYHYRFEAFADSFPFPDGTAVPSEETARVLAEVKQRFCDDSFRGSFVRHTAEALAVRSAKRFYSGQETVEKQCVSSVLSDTADACAALMLLFYLEMTSFGSMAELLLKKEPSCLVPCVDRNQNSSDCFLVGVCGAKRKDAIPVKITLCDDFPAFSIRPLSGNKRTVRMFSGCFRIVRAGAGKFYITVSKYDFKRILRFRKKSVCTSVFLPYRQDSYVVFFQPEK